MTGEQVTEREAALAARVKELEDAATIRKTDGTSDGGLIEQIWRYFSAFVPSWIILCGVAMFVGFHAWEYFNKTKIQAAETEIAKAKAAIDYAKGDAVRTELEGAKAEVQRMAAEVAKKQYEASRARTEADAQNAIFDKETVRAQQLRAELAKKQANAEVARAAAEAATTRAGLHTLERQAQEAQLMKTVLQGKTDEVKAALQAMVRGDRSGPSITDAACRDNRYANLLACPARYVVAPQPVEKPQPSSAQFATVNAPELNVRKCPKPDDRECPGVRIPTGQRVKLLTSAGNGWVQIEAATPLGENVTGYVNGKFLKAE
jgi:hypothetical protein